MEALTGLINTYSKKGPLEQRNTRINNNHNNRAEERAPPTDKAFQGRAHLKTDIKETNNIQKKKNRYRQKLTQTNTISHNTNHDNIECQNIHTDNNINHTTDTKDDDSLVMLVKQTTLTDSQKNVLRKGLNFIPKPKSLLVQTLHTDIRNFMHILKTIYELRTTNRPQRNIQNPGADPGFIRGGFFV